MTPAALSGLDLLATAVILVDNSDVLRHMNPAAENLLELSSSAVLGRDLAQVFADYDLLTAALQYARRNNCSFSEHGLAIAVSGRPGVLAGVGRSASEVVIPCGGGKLHAGCRRADREAGRAFVEDFVGGRAWSRTDVRPHVSPGRQSMRWAYLLKLACTDELPVMVSVQLGEVPEHAPPQFTNSLPAGGIAVSVTDVPEFLNIGPNDWGNGSLTLSLNGGTVRVRRTDTQAEVASASVAEASSSRRRRPARCSGLVRPPRSIAGMCFKRLAASTRISSATSRTWTSACAGSWRDGRAGTCQRPGCCTANPCPRATTRCSRRFMSSGIASTACGSGCPAFCWCWHHCSRSIAMRCRRTPHGRTRVRRRAS